jgi:hypothetical protein
VPQLREPPPVPEHHGAPQALLCLRLDFPAIPALDVHPLKILAATDRADEGDFGTRGWVMGFMGHCINLQYPDFAYNSRLVWPLRKPDDGRDGALLGTH